MVSLNPNVTGIFFQQKKKVKLLASSIFLSKFKENNEKLSIFNKFETTWGAAEIKHGNTLPNSNFIKEGKNIFSSPFCALCYKGSLEYWIWTLRIEEDKK